MVRPFPDIVRERREQLGLTLEALAERIGSHAPTLCNAMQGRCGLSLVSRMLDGLEFDGADRDAALAAWAACKLEQSGDAAPQ